jgi:hypothetical protein
VDDWAAVAGELLREITPDVSSEDLTLIGLDFDGTDGEPTFRIDNPNGVGLLQSAGAMVDAILDDSEGVHAALYATSEVPTPFGTVPWDEERDRVLTLS